MPILLDVLRICCCSLSTDTALVSAMVLTFARDVSKAEPTLTESFARFAS